MRRDLLFLLLLLLTTSAVRGQRLLPDTLGKEALAEDFRIFRKALEERHPGIDRYRSPGSFAAALDQAGRQIDRPMTVNEFHHLLAGPVDILDCGHTELQFTKKTSASLRKTARLLPFKFGINDEHLFIRWSYSPDTSLGVGMDVLTINGYPTDSLIRSWTSFFTSDGYNETMKERTAENFFREYFAVFVEQPDSFTLVLRRHNSNDMETIRVGNMTYPELEKRYNARFEKGGPPKKMSHYQLDSNTVVLNIETFQGRDLRKSHVRFRHEVRKTVREMNRKGYRNLVIDLRDNTGGNVNLGIFLYRQIARQPFRYIDSATVPNKKPIRFCRYTDKTCFYNLNFLAVKKSQGRYVYRIHHLTKTHRPASHAFQGEVYILTNGITFSNASNFAALVQFQERGKIIGEESGGAMNGCNGLKYFDVTLPNSKLVLRIPLAQVTYPFQPYSNYGHGVKPDFEIADHPYCPRHLEQYEFLYQLFFCGKHSCPLTGN